MAPQGKREEELNALDVDDVVTGYELAYLVQTRTTWSAGSPCTTTPSSAPATARILAEWNALQTVDRHRQQPVQRQRAAQHHAGGQRLQHDRSHRAAAAAPSARWRSPTPTTAAAPARCTRTPTNAWGDGQQYIDGGSTTDANGQTAAVNAMWGLMNTYDMLKNTLGWHSLDGKNTATYIAVHVNTAYDNAYYSDTCKCMSIGDGGTMFNSLGSIDVIGHEMGHGVTAATSRPDLLRRIGRPERIEFGHHGRSGGSLRARRRHRRRPSRQRQRLDAGQGNRARRHAAALDVQAEQGRPQPGRLEQHARSASTSTTAAARTTACSTSCRRARTRRRTASTTAIPDQDAGGDDRHRHATRPTASGSRR